MKLRISSLVVLVLTLLSTVRVFAQDRDINVDVDLNRGGGAAWYNNYWIWIVGGAVFVLLLVALLRGRGGRGDA